MSRLSLASMLILCLAWMGCASDGTPDGKTVAKKPSAPTNINAVPGDGQVTLTWDAASGDVTSYNIYVDTNAGVTIEDTKLADVTSPYAHTGLTNGTTYFYVVTAKGPGGESSLSIETSAMPQVEIPDAPDGVSAESGDEQITISWNAVAGAESYNMYWKNSALVTTTDTKIAGVTSPYIFDNLTNDTPYYCVVTAVHAGGESAISAEVSATPQTPIPGVPSGVSAEAGVGQVTIDWDPVDGAAAYNIYWKTSAGVTKSDNKLAAVTAPFVHSISDETHYYVVTAENSGGESDISSEVSAKPVVIPDAPMNVVATAQVEAIKIEWDEVEGATSYILYYGNSSGVTPDPGTNKIKNITSPTYTQTYRTGGRTYYYVVVAVNAAGKSVASEEVSAKTKYKYAFVTSTTGDGNLGSWTDAGGNTGIAAADAICQAHATRAELPGTYRAWISDSTTDAYCHIQGRTGKKVTCDMEGAGAWGRVDGLPFIGSLYEVTTSLVVYHAIELDENGDPAPGSYWTGTQQYGQLNGTTCCSDWTSASSGDSAAKGISTYESYAWSAGGSYGCGGGVSSGLLCLQTGSGMSLYYEPVVGKRVFLTSTTHDGNFGGLSNADAICQTAATNASLTGTFKAWLSTSTVNAIDHVTANQGISAGPWVRMDGIQVAASKADLTDGKLETAITMFANGTYASSAAMSSAWTGTKANGTVDSYTCSDWTTNVTFNGTVWLPASTNISNLTAIQCSIPCAIFCFED